MDATSFLGVSSSTRQDMGITGLGAFLRKKCPLVFQAFPSASLYGRRVALDMHLYTYQMFYRNGGDEKALKQDVGKLVDRLLRDGITAVCVFDGNTAGKKPEAHRKRREAADRVQTDLAQTKALASSLSAEEESDVYVFKDDGVSVSGFSSVSTILDDDTSLMVPDLKRRRVECEERIQKLEARVMKPTSDTFDVVKAILTSGLGDDAVVTAEDDAERYVSYLCQNGDVDFAASGDYDTLVFGSPNVILDFLKADAMLLVRLDDVISALGLRDLSAFRDFCILCGCDFCTKIPKVGPVTALKLVVEHGSIEGIYSAGKYKPDPDFDYSFARRRFASSDTKIDDAAAVGADHDVTHADANSNCNDVHVDVDHDDAKSGTDHEDAKSGTDHPITITANDDALDADTRLVKHVIAEKNEECVCVYTEPCTDRAFKI